MTLFDVSKIAENGESKISNISLVDQDDSEYGNILKEAELTDALLSDNTQVFYFFVTSDGGDISPYQNDGSLYFKIWSRNAYSCVLEIGSSANNDQEELQWTNVNLQAGWNQVSLKLSSGSISGTVKYNSIIRLRMFSVGKTDTFLLSDVLVGETAYLPGNTTGDAAKDVDIAVNAITSNLNVDDQEEYTIDVRAARSDSEEVVLQKILAVLEEGISKWTKNVDNIYNVEITTACESKDKAEITVKMEEAEKKITVKPNLLYYDKTQAQLVDSIYSKDEVITAAIIIGEGAYTLDKTGVSDCTEVIQRAMDDCSDAGGGTVWLPAGYYRITDMLKVPTYVTLRGDWQDPDKVSNASDLQYGTILLADLEDESTPLVYVGGSAGAEGLTIYYLDQSMSEVKKNSYAIYNEGEAFTKADQRLHTIKNCTIINGYKGVGICDSLYSTASVSEQTYIYNVKGTFLNTGLYNYNSSDNGGTIGFTAKADYWVDFADSRAYEDICRNLSLTKATVKKDDIVNYTKQAGIGVHIGDLEGDYFTDITVEGYRYGIQVNYGARTTYYGDLYNLDVSDCKLGIQFNSLSGFGVNIACSKFYDNEKDIENNTTAQVKLADVAYETVTGNTVYTTSDEKLTEKISGYTDISYGVTEKRLKVFSYNAESGVSLTGQLQNALDEVGAAGGGVLYLPAGHYKLEKALTVPANTELRGCAGSAVRPSKVAEGGTVIEVPFGEKSEDPMKDAAIVLNGKNAGVTGLILAFPTQTPNEPMTTGYGIVGKDAEGAFVANCSVLAFSHGIYMEKCNDYVITGVLFACLQNNITAKDCKGGEISCCLQNLNPLIRNTYDYPTWWEMQGGTVTPTFTYTATYLDCIVLDGSTDQMIWHWYAYRPHDTIILKNASDVKAFNYGAGGLDGDTVGVLLTAEDKDCKALSINSHQKYRYTVEAADGADIQVYNRLTLEGSTLVSVEDSYQSVGDNDYCLVEPGVSLLSEIAQKDGYDLSKGGTISYGLNYDEYSVTYNFSKYAVMAINFEDVIATSNANFILQLNGKKVSFDIEKAGKQTIYLAMDQFGDDLSEVKISSFTLQADSEVTTCKVTSVYLLKELPKDGKLTETGSGEKPRVILTNTERATAGSYSTILVSEAPKAEKLISDSKIWTITSKQPNGTFKFDGVNIKPFMEDGYFHFNVYIPEGGENSTYVLEVTSSGKADEKELQYVLGKDNKYYDVEFKTGWNEIWLPISGGSASGYIDFSAVNFIRFRSETKTESELTYYLDGFEVVRRAYVDKGVVNNSTKHMLWEKEADLKPATDFKPDFVSLESYGKTGYGIFAESAKGGTTVYARHLIQNPKHVADYSGGYLHLSLYVKDEEVLANLGKLQLELTSGACNDKKELQWSIDKSNTQFEVGWNEVYFPLLKSYSSMGSGGYTDFNRIDFFRVFFEENAGATSLILADMYVTMDCPEEISEGNLVVAGITKTTPAAPEVKGSYQASKDQENFTYTIDAIEGAEYRMDGGEWQDSNVFEGILKGSSHVFEARVKGNRYYKTGNVGSSGEVIFDKLTQTAPKAFTLTFTLNEDQKTYTATIPKYENALYSFDGEHYSAENTKTDCQPGTSYTGYVKYAETALYKESETASDTQTAPVLEKKEDPDNTNKKNDEKLVGTYYPSESDSSSKNQTISAKTGDSGNAGIYLAALMAASVCLWIMKRSKRKEN